MVTPAGLFDSFNNLDTISPEAIESWLKNPPPLVHLENYLANRILYPQTVPLTTQDMNIDLAILREALKASPKDQTGNNAFINASSRKILIPVRFLNFVPDLANLAIVFIDALLLTRKKQNEFEDLWTIVLTDGKEEIAGSVILPQWSRKSGVVLINSSGKTFKISCGNLTVIPGLKPRCAIAYQVQNGQILGKSESAVEVYGGRLGLVIDGRVR